MHHALLILHHALIESPRRQYLKLLNPVKALQESFSSLPMRCRPRCGIREGFAVKAAGGTGDCCDLS